MISKSNSSVATPGVVHVTGGLVIAVILALIGIRYLFEK
jgi:hypothetical protein